MFWLSKFQNSDKFLKVNSYDENELVNKFDPIEWIQIVAIIESTSISSNLSYRKILQQNDDLQTLETKFMLWIQLAKNNYFFKN